MPGWICAGFQLGVVLTNVQLAAMPLPFAVLDVRGEPRAAGAFEALSPDDAWIPKKGAGSNDSRPKGERDRRGRKNESRGRRDRGSPCEAALQLEGLPPMTWRQVKDLCHNHDDAVTIGRVQDPVDGRCRVPFDTRAHASDAMNRINDDDGPVRATLVS